MPDSYVIADQGSRFVLVLEDLHAADDLQLFTNRDMIEGVSVERAEQCLSAFASLHAAFERLGAAERTAILPPELHPFNSPNARALSPLLSRGAMGMLDWQAVQWAKGMRDVQYFLINSMPEALLAEHEQALIEHYVAELDRHGMTLGFDQAWDQYRGLSFQTLMTSVVSLGTASMTDMDEVLRTILGRSVAAIRRIGFGDWLDEQVTRSNSA